MNNGQGPPGSHHIGPRRFLLRPGVVAGVATLAVATGYVVQVRDGALSARELFVVIVLAMAAAGGIVGSAVTIPRARGVLISFATGVMLSVGVLSLASFGIPLVAAGLISAAGWFDVVQHGAPRRTHVAVAFALLAAFGLVFVGVSATR